MDETIKELLIQSIIYISVIGLGFFIGNYLTNGFLFKYIITKASRGKKVLVELQSVQRNYWKVGKVEEGLLKFKNSAKTKLSLPVNREDFKRLMGIDYIIIDESTNIIIKPTGDLRVQDNFDWVDNLITRALERPTIMNNATEIFKWLLWILTFLCVIYLIYKIQGLETVIKQIPKIAVVGN